MVFKKFHLVEIIQLDLIPGIWWVFENVFCLWHGWCFQRGVGPAEQKSLVFLHPLKRTASSAPENWPFAPKRKLYIVLQPSIHFQVRRCEFQGGYFDLDEGTTSNRLTYFLLASWTEFFFKYNFSICKPESKTARWRFAGAFRMAPFVGWKNGHRFKGPFFFSDDDGKNIIFPEEKCRHRFRTSRFALSQIRLCRRTAVSPKECSRVLLVDCNNVRGRGRGGRFVSWLLEARFCWRPSSFLVVFLLHMMAFSWTSKMWFWQMYCLERNIWYFRTSSSQDDHHLALMGRPF